MTAVDVFLMLHTLNGDYNSSFLYLHNIKLNSSQLFRIFKTLNVNFMQHMYEISCLTTAQRLKIIPQKRQFYPNCVLKFAYIKEVKKFTETKMDMG